MNNPLLLRGLMKYGSHDNSNTSSNKMPLLFYYTNVGTLSFLQIETGYVGSIQFLFNNTNLSEAIVMLLEQNVHICRKANNVEIEGGKNG